MSNNIKKFLEQSWLLVVLSFFFGLLIAITNAQWDPLIQQNKIDKLNKLMTGMLGDAKTFEKVLENADITLESSKAMKVSVYKAISESGQVVGWAFNCEGSGFADKIELVVTLGADAKEFKGYDVLFSNETPGFGDQIKFDYFRNQFMGAPAKKLELSKAGDAEKIDDQIIAITGATVSSNAVVAIIDNYIEPVKKLLNEKGLVQNVN